MPKPKRPVWKAFAWGTLASVFLVVLSSWLVFRDAYWGELVARSFADSWSLVVGVGWVGLAVLAAMWIGEILRENGLASLLLLKAMFKRAASALVVPFVVLGGVFCIFLLGVTPYRMVTEAEAELEEADSISKISFVMDAGGLTTGNDGKRNYFGFVFWITVANSGARTTVQITDILLVSRDGSRHIGRMPPAGTESQFKEKEALVEVKRDDNLFYKLVDRPVESGIPVGGYLILLFGDAKSEPEMAAMASGGNIFLHFRDGYGKRGRFSSPLSLGSPGSMTHIPAVPGVRFGRRLPTPVITKTKPQP